MIGRVVSRYKIVTKLGQGGMGVVYQALDLRLNRPVALKFLHPQLTHSFEQIANLEKEALAISALNHPNIATIYGIEEVDDFKFLLLEYLPGGTLKSRIEKSVANGRQLTLEEALTYAIQIADGLAHAHQQGIIHRDVKSSNILFSAQDNIKIADFSLASSGKEAYGNPALGVAGTPSSMSPEQAQGRELDHRSDIFSFGIVLFELITAKMPFRAVGHTEVLREIILTPAPSLSEFRPGVPAALESIVTKTLQKDREKRYQRISDLAADLRSAREQLNPRAPLPVEPETITLGLAPRKRLNVPKIAVDALLAAASWAGFEIPSIRQGILTLVHMNMLPSEKRLAVLNFVNAGDNPELSDGLMDVLSSKLTEMEQFHGSLLVISPAEVRKAEVKTPSEAREAFGATLVITGRVQQHGDRLVVLMNLVDTETLTQLRSVTIDTSFPDAAALQEGLVAKAGEMLDITLAPKEFLALQAGNTQVPAAYRYYVEGRGYLQRFDSVEHADKAVAVFQRAIRIDAKYALAYSGLAEARVDQFNVTKDPQAIDDAFNSASRGVELNRSLATVRVTLGRVLSEKGLYEQAEQEFADALKLDPVNAEAYRRLAHTYQRLGRLNEAEKIYRKAIQLRPNDWRGYRDLGSYFFNKGALAEAEQQYQRALKLTPGNYNAYNDLGAVHTRMGKYAEATTELEKSVALKPLAINYSNLGSVYYLQERYRDAARCYEKAVFTTSTNASWWGNLADAYRWTPALSWKAPEAYRRAIDLGLRELTTNTRNGRLRSRVACYYAAIGEKDSASQEITEALRATNNDGYVLFRAALVREQLGQRDAALAAIQAAVRTGYPLEEIRRVPTLKNLRGDPRYPATLNSK